MTIRAIVFDLGETLLNETRLWAAWADWLGVSHLTLFAVLGAVIERGERHQRALELVRPGLRLAEERAARSAAGAPDRFTPDDLYPDAVPCLAALRAAGYRIGIAGNFSADFTEAVRESGLAFDFVASSQEWGVEKPSPQFFVRVAQAAGFPPQQIAYVGDRLDNDVLPALAAGMTAVFLRRGPWGHIQALRPEAERATLRIESLGELVGALQRLAPIE